ncbi:PLP-dependent aminotransferase family protein [Entomohabitans teleogrylli]|uniref:aminotransferase-like domain-containing protein n=1 Tax=Entomohabitans teleogrylli TaxID=1384589 RepID=UPI00073D8B0F|nr:PLP-dependent aminotransferase family protein [Entomohabitans teleogrylli]
MTRYQHLANILAQRIEQGLYRSGEKLPSVRNLSQEHGVSISTVQQAYQQLEMLQLIVPQPRSGYFVAPRKAQPPVPSMSRPVQRPVEVTQWDQVLALLYGRGEKGLITLGSGSPDVSQASLKPLWREMNRVIQHNVIDVLNYDELYGRRELREQISRLMLDSGTRVGPDDIVITNGCHGALSAALLSVCKPGDIVAVESPSFHGTMQMLRGFGIKAIEIPTDASTGISVEALELALEQWPIKGVILVPDCNNPLGFIMPEARKKALLSLARRHDIVIFEDDIYGELATDYPRPRTIQSFDIDGRVLLCSSFTKTIAPGLRVGWIVPGRYLDRVLHMKYVVTGTTVPSTQMAVAAFIRDGHYHRHVRRMRQIYRRNMETMTCWVRQYFPCGICVTRPQGGFMLWVELPENVDMIAASQQLREMKIQVAPGSLFSAAGKYRNCLRLNCALVLGEPVRAAVKQIGEVLNGMLDQAPPLSTGSGVGGADE